MWKNSLSKEINTIAETNRSSASAHIIWRAHCTARRVPRHKQGNSTEATSGLAQHHVVFVLVFVYECFQQRPGPWCAYQQGLSTLVCLDCLQLYSGVCESRVGPTLPGLDDECFPSLTFAEEGVILSVHFPRHSSLLSLDESFSEWIITKAEVLSYHSPFLTLCCWK